MNKLLLVIDCQKAFINNYTKDCLDRVNDLLGKKRYSNVVFTIFKNSSESPFFKLLGYDGCMSDSDCELMLDYDADVIEKNTYSAVNSELIQYISEHNIEEVYLCGFDTDGCVLKTAFDLFEKKIRTYILKDYCMSSGGEKYHNEAIDILERSIGTEYIV